MEFPTDREITADHTVAVARVLGMEAVVKTGALVFFRGRYGRFVGVDGI